MYLLYGAQKKLSQNYCQLMGILFTLDLYKYQEKTHLLWRALSMCSVAVRLAPPLGLEPRTL